MEFQNLIVEKKENIAIVKLNRPPVNVLSSKVYTELFEAFSHLENDESVHGVVLTASGDKAFCAGLDVKEVEGKEINEISAFVWGVSKKTMDKISSFPRPTVCALFGLALGGGFELALVCDFRIASKDAQMGFPEINLGIIPGSGGTVRLPRLIGIPKAKEILLSGENISADYALSLGLLNKVVERDNLLEEALILAKKLASKPKIAYMLIKRCVDSGMEMDISSALNFELSSFIVAYNSYDGKEGLKAFVEKRKPEFKGK
ncbi:MAG: enoyl-CoA hydratase/isomerase family protein [Desulfobacterota bacterium]|nr:enoyl-CoA hydratase/isomerase family protein [Thermodesulfobacteriota bacterium]MDW8002767.1 enoyl-CoA hydratase/isomerase family protein [Deltaproteobacteria bacterium]